MIPRAALSASQDSREEDDSFEPTSKKAERLGVSTRTLKRWIDAGILEQPRRINGRLYHRVRALPRCE
jgi:MerR family regulatory protein